MKKFFLAFFAIVAIVATFVLTSSLAGTGFEYLSFVPFVGFAGRQRSIFKSLEKKYGEGNVSQSYLRVEATLNITKLQYKFSFNRVANTDIATENKLDTNDIFIASEMGLFLSNQLSTAIGQEVLNTYPDPLIFTGNSAADAAALESVYSGNLEMKQGSTVWIPKFPNLWFRQVTNKQSNAAISSVTGAFKNEFDLRKHLIELGGNIKIVGSDNTEVTVNVNTLGSTAFAPGTNYSYKMVLILTGYKITAQ